MGLESRPSSSLRTPLRDLRPPTRPPVLKAHSDPPAAPTLPHLESGAGDKVPFLGTGDRVTFSLGCLAGAPAVHHDGHRGQQQRQPMDVPQRPAAAVKVSLGVFLGVAGLGLSEVPAAEGSHEDRAPLPPRGAEAPLARLLGKGWKSEVGRPSSGPDWRRPRVERVRLATEVGLRPARGLSCLRVTRGQAEPRFPIVR